MLLPRDDSRVLLVSGVAMQRTNDPREGRLTRRLYQGIVDAAGPKWRILTSWGEEDGEVGAMRKLKQADAVVIMGGPDISPSFYGGAADYPNAETHFPRSDKAQMSLITRSIETGVPLLGICRGMQALNVALGGTLQQDIAQPGHSNKTFLDDLLFEEHDVHVKRGSRISHMLSPEKNKRIRGRSAHHQAVDQLGSGLEVTAHSPDGIVEAVEHQDAPVFGFQWHPEAVGAHPEHLRSVLFHMRDAEGIMRMRTGATAAA